MCNFVSAQPLCDPQRRRISNPVYCTISMYHFDVSQLRSARAGVWLSPAPRGVLSRYLGKSRKSQVGSSRLWIWTDLEHLRGSDRHSLRTLSVWGSHVLCRMWVLSSCSAPIEAGACTTLAIKDSNSRHLYTETAGRGRGIFSPLFSCSCSRSSVFVCASRRSSNPLGFRARGSKPFAAAPRE